MPRNDAQKSAPMPVKSGLPLPHERDESAGPQATGGTGDGAAAEGHQRVMKQAKRDLDEGQVDTDLHATPGLDAPRRKELLKPAR